MKLTDFRVGDRVLSDDNNIDKFEATVTCIHSDALYLNQEDGYQCSEHNGSWICNEVRGEVFSNSDNGEPLKLIRRMIHPRINNFNL